MMDILDELCCPDYNSVHITVVEGLPYGDNHNENFAEYVFKGGSDQETQKKLGSLINSFNLEFNTQKETHIEHGYIISFYVAINSDEELTKVKQLNTKIFDQFDIFDGDTNPTEVDLLLL